jgi:hypothetical protein
MHHLRILYSSSARPLLILYSSSTYYLVILHSSSTQPLLILYASPPSFTYPPLTFCSSSTHPSTHPCTHPCYSSMYSSLHSSIYSSPTSTHHVLIIFSSFPPLILYAPSAYPLLILDSPYSSSGRCAQPVLCSSWTHPTHPLLILYH